MCTAIYESSPRPLFGRTLDLECSYGESIVLTPRLFELRFIHESSAPSHQAILGVACLHEGYPLYYDAVNEAGLAAAALSFMGNARYRPKRKGAYNIASAELIPWLLSRAESLSDALSLLRHTNITKYAVSREHEVTPLHWLIADKSGALTLETGVGGVKIYENPVGVLSNSPPFDYQMTNLANYMSAKSAPPQNTLCPDTELVHYSRGMGGLGLPGDFSSPSRFVRAVFAKNHTSAAKNKKEAVSRFFHIMDTVSQPRGSALTESGEPISTVYTCCADLSEKTYYFTTYDCRQIRAVTMSALPLDGDRPISFPMHFEEKILYLE